MNPNQEQPDIYMLDIKSTIIANIMNLVVLLLIYFFILFYMQVVNSLQEEGFRTLALIGLCFFITKLGSWFNIEFMYKNRETNNPIKRGKDEKKILSLFDNPLS